MPDLMATLTPGLMATIAHADACADPRANQHAVRTNSAESVIVYFDSSFSECGDTCDYMATIMVDLMRFGTRTGCRTDHRTNASFKHARYINVCVPRQL